MKITLLRHNLKVTFSYDGTEYRGFQKQKDQEKTIAGTLEKAINKVFKEAGKLTAAGRTDSGVHAVAQVVNFKVVTKIPLAKIKGLLNKFLPQDIIVSEVTKVAETFCARRSAKSRVYRYFLYQEGERIYPWIKRYHALVSADFDLVLAQEACKLLEGKHDFNAFMNQGSKATSTVKKVLRCNLVKHTDKQFMLEIEAESFLYHMVRILIANIVRVAEKKLSIAEFKEILTSRKRQKAGKMFPSNGLFLYQVHY